MQPNEELGPFCETVARAGAEQLIRWQGRISAREKAPSDLVTEADLASQQAICTAIHQRFPQHAILSEESPGAEPFAKLLSEPTCWIVDPLDGTTNYVHGFPFFAVSVAVAHEGELVAGVVLDPLREECFTAVRGQGAWLNGEPIRVSPTTELRNSLLAVSLPPRVAAGSHDLRAFLEVVSSCRAIRRTGSAALNLAYVASGRLDGHWAHKIYPWDAAAGVLLVREAGGMATASRGGAFNLAEANYLVAGTPTLHQSLLERVAPPKL